ncbi:UNVERIFIED_CONTAM: Crossover junction endonuclease mus81 [Siphonaria sp. JEL0065]|nr:Crossover junction endonuclease mus81 [Siphonaria sp. JEL0065]
MAGIANLKELCQQWIYDIYEEEKALAIARNSQSNVATVYKKAHAELSKYPLPITSVRQLVVVKGIGPGIIKTLELKLDAHLKRGGYVDGLEPADHQQDLLRKPRCDAIVEAMAAEQQPRLKRRKAPPEYVPKYRSGAWSILVTLHAAKGYLSKHEIIKNGQEHADTPMDATGGAQYSGWSAMQGLLEKELIMKYGGPPRFILTEDGTVLVERMLASLKGNSTLNNNNADDDGGIDIIDAPTTKSFTHTAAATSRPPLAPSVPTRLASNGSSLSNSSSNSSSTFTSTVPSLKQTHSSLSTQSATDEPDIHSFTLAAGSYDIVLILDNREIKNGQSRDFFKEGLAKRNVKFDNRSLDLGDVTWIARPKCEGSYHGDEEIMLEYIVERKTLDDLVSSIKDGRFKEQKFRLSSCGVPNVIYVIEEVSTEMAETFGYEGVYTAITQTQVENGFFVKKTYSAEDTLAYLVSMTNLLKQIYEDKTLVFDTKRPKTVSGSSSNTNNNNTVFSISFAEFGQRNSKTKNFSLGDVWIRQLLTLPGMSAEKACFFARTYKTSARFRELNSLSFSSTSFFKALMACSNDTEREKMIQDAGGEGRRAIGASLGKKMMNVFWRAEESEIVFQGAEK